MPRREEQRPRRDRRRGLRRTRVEARPLDR